MDEAYKYKFNPSMHGVLRKVVKYIDRNQKVLDVGCGAGHLGDLLKTKNCRLMGIDLHADELDRSKLNYENILSLDIETAESLEYPNGYFDVIVYADLLEHLKEPQLLLRKLDKYLHPQGKIIVSIPNIAYWRSRANLLLGRFDYQEHGGLLDETHLRFFTLKTAKLLLEKGGYEIAEIDYTGIASMIHLFPRLLAFQFIVVGQKRHLK